MKTILDSYKKVLGEFTIINKKRGDLLHSMNCKRDVIIRDLRPKIMKKFKAKIGRSYCDDITLKDITDRGIKFHLQWSVGGYGEYDHYHTTIELSYEHIDMTMEEFDLWVADYAIIIQLKKEDEETAKQALIKSNAENELKKHYEILKKRFEGGEK